MGKVIEDGLTPAVQQFIAKQRVFFVATAPSDTAHHVNVSPKTAGSALAVLDQHTLAFADLSGSGSETAAHVLQNSRITFMFCNIEPGSPQIIRVYGTASIVLPGEAPAELLAAFDGGKCTASAGLRAIFVTRVKIARSLACSASTSSTALSFSK